MKIQLPPFILADLYKSSLVITDETTPTLSPIHEETPPADFLGSNHKNISVVVNDKQNRFLDTDSQQLLVNMLAALQLTLADVAVINLHVTPYTYKQLAEKLQTRICLMFAVTTQQIGLPFQMPDYKVQLFDNCKYVSSTSLQNMTGNGKEAKVEKTKLWMSLKTIFE